MTKERIIDKIEKLLRLATSPNEHEAAAASARAQKLMEKHQIDVLELGGEDEENTLQAMDDFIEGKQRYEGWYTNFFNSLAMAYDLDPYFSKRRRYTGLRVIGLKSDILLFKQVFAYLIETITRLHKSAYKDHKATLAPWEKTSRQYSMDFRKDFCYGCATGIVKNIREQKAKRAQEAVQNRELVVVKDAIIKSFVDKGDYNFGKAKAVAGPSYSEAYRQGVVAGLQVGVDTQIGG